MTRAWRTLATAASVEGRLELRLRGDDEFLIVVGGRVLMTSRARRSEEALATLAVARIADHKNPRVLVGGLGMAYTLRATLDALPRTAHVDVAELQPEIVDWCRGPLAPLTDAAVADARVTVAIADVARMIADAPGNHWDAILLDLYEGPRTATQKREDPLYGNAALLRAHAALRKGGVLAIWSEDPDPPFPARLETAGFTVETERAGKGGRSHVIYLATKRAPNPRAPHARSFH